VHGAIGWQNLIQPANIMWQQHSYTLYWEWYYLTMKDIGNEVVMANGKPKPTKYGQLHSMYDSRLCTSQPIHTHIRSNNTGCPRKKCTKFMHYNFATVCHKVMQFSAKCSDRNSLHNKRQCLKTAIKYSLFCSWQAKYLETKLTEKSSKQICGVNKVPAKPAFQN